MDTWATSSLTPQIAGGWEDDPDLFARVFPMDLRPQAHEIIRTWLFYTVARAHYEHDSLPWKTTTISGWVLDPDRKKMSKSKGNVVTPMALLEEHGSDGVRYWAASGRPGTDTAFDPGSDEGRPAPRDEAAQRVAFRAGAGRAARAGDGAGRSRDADQPRAPRRGRDGAVRRLPVRDRARAHRALVLVVLRRLPRAGEVAPLRSAGARAGRVGQQRAARQPLRAAAPVRAVPAVRHRGSLVVVARRVRCTARQWPEPLRAAGAHRRRRRIGAAPALERAALVLGEVRKTKSEAKRKLSTPVERLVVRDTAEHLAALRTAEADLRSSGFVRASSCTRSPRPSASR